MDFTSSNIPQFVGFARLPKLGQGADSGRPQGSAAVPFGFTYRKP